MRFLAPVLRALDRTYRFENAIPSISSVELAAPVSLVHDVSRESHYQAFDLQPAFAALQDGWRVAGTVIGHIGAGTIASTPTSPYTLFGINANRHWMWHFRTHASTTVAAAVTSGTAFMSNAAPLQTDPFVLLDWVNTTGLTAAAGTVAVIIPRYEWGSWFPVYPGTLWSARSTVSAACDVTVQSTYLVLPRGVPPMFAH